MKNQWKFEPAVWKGIVAGLVTLLAIWGLDVADLGDKLNQTIDVLGVLAPLIASGVAGLWIRQSVTPNEKVAVVVEPGAPETVAGPALPVPDGTPVDVYTFPEEDPRVTDDVLTVANDGSD